MLILIRKLCEIWKLIVSQRLNFPTTSLAKRLENFAHLTDSVRTDPDLKRFKGLAVQDSQKTSPRHFSNLSTRDNARPTKACSRAGLITFKEEI